jgi:hypothetical protein
MMDQKLVKARFYVAVITDDPGFVANAERYLQIVKSVDMANTIATLTNKTSEIKPIYVIVKRGAKWRKFQDFPWRQIHFFSSDKEYVKAFDKIKKDVTNWKLIQSQNN